MMNFLLGENHPGNVAVIFGDDSHLHAKLGYTPPCSASLFQDIQVVSIDFLDRFGWEG